MKTNKLLRFLMGSVILPGLIGVGVLLAFVIDLAITHLGVTPVVVTLTVLLGLVSGFIAMSDEDTTE